MSYIRTNSVLAVIAFFMAGSALLSGLGSVLIVFLAPERLQGNLGLFMAAVAAQIFISSLVLISAVALMKDKRWGGQGLLVISFILFVTSIFYIFFSVADWLEKVSVFIFATLPLAIYGYALKRRIRVMLGVHGHH